MKYWPVSNAKMTSPDKNVVPLVIVGVVLVIWLAKHNGLNRIPEDAASFIDHFGV